jgi:hypothetical protein
MILAGIDEAGYGPLLGPLVVSATAFDLPQLALTDEPDAVPCLWRALKSAVAKKAPAKKGRLLVADSKVVHGLTDGNKLLERGVLAFIRCLPPSHNPRPTPASSPAAVPCPPPGDPGTTLAPHPPATAASLLDFFSCSNHELATHPWYAPHEVPIPWLAEPGDLAIATNMLANALATANVRVAAMRTQLVSERAFNRLVGGTNNKASALVSITLGHLYYLHTTFGEQGLLVTIDKQGGRDHYTQLLLEAFPDAQLKVLLESAKASHYLLHEPRPGGTPRRTLILFREKGETASLPTALASMICKYLRELCMHSFNAWWCRQIDGLKPTAGYYNDGSRWLLDVEPHLPRLGITRDLLVRIR